MKLAVIIVVLLCAAAGYWTWSSREGKREIQLQRDAMTKAKSFRTKVTAKGVVYTGYEGEVVCPDKLHFVLHSQPQGFLQDGTEYVKYGTTAYTRTPQGDWHFADAVVNIPDPCLNATNDPTGKSAASDALEDKAEGSRGEWRSVNGDTCREWSFKIPMPGKNVEYEECIGADHLPREFKSLDGTYTAYYSDFGVPFVIDKPQVQFVQPQPRYQPEYRKYQPPPPPKKSPDPEIPD